MKKITAILVLAAALFTSAAAYASDDRPVTVAELPAPAQQFIKTHFADVAVSYAKMDKGILDTSYDVIFVDGRKVEFAKNGDWSEVDCKHSQVPSGIVPMPINTYVKTNYPEQKIVKIDRDNRDYEVELQNGLDLKFDKSFKLIGIDD